MSDTRQDAIRKIQRLSQMTIANGCSEAEAATAMEHITRLRAAHGLSEAELRAEARSCGLGEGFLFIGPRDWATCLHAISRLFNVISYTEYDTITIFDDMIEGRRLRVFGYPLDVASATAMAELCYTAIASETEAYRKQPNTTGRGRRNFASFRYGMAERLHERILALLPKANTSQSMALVPLKDQLVKSEWEKMGIHLVSAPSKSYRDAASLAAGRSAANRVDLGHAAKLGATKQIGRS